MIESKYGKVLTVILVIVVIGVLILLGFLGYDVYKKYTSDKTVAEVMDDFEETISSNSNRESNATVDNTEISLGNLQINEITTGGSSSSGTSNVVQYEGYNVVGTIEIPAIDLKYPILERTTPDSIELAVAILYTANGLNQPGNTLIVGHNYRSGAFFGNNDKLQLNEKVYITDTSGTRIRYNIYNIYETSAEDGDFIMRETNGKREISLSTCTNNSKARLIIWAVEE